MSVRAVYKDGTIQPIDPVPPDWADGQELLIEPSESPDGAELQRWADDVEAAAQAIPPEDHERAWQAIQEHRVEAKEWMRRRIGL